MCFYLYFIGNLSPHFPRMIRRLNEGYVVKKTFVLLGRYYLLFDSDQKKSTKFLYWDDTAPTGEKGLIGRWPPRRIVPRPGKKRRPTVGVSNKKEALIWFDLIKETVSFHFHDLSFDSRAGPWPNKKSSSSRMQMLNEAGSSGRLYRDSILKVRRALCTNQRRPFFLLDHVKPIGRCWFMFTPLRRCHAADSSSISVNLATAREIKLDEPSFFFGEKLITLVSCQHELPCVKCNDFSKLNVSSFHWKRFTQKIL